MSLCLVYFQYMLFTHRTHGGIDVKRTCFDRERKERMLEAQLKQAIGK